MASNFRRKSASSDSNRRPAPRGGAGQRASRDAGRRAAGSRGAAQRPRRAAGQPSSGSGQDWHAVAGGRYTPSGDRTPVTSVRVGDLDRLERQSRAQKRYHRYLVRLSIVVAILAALAIGAVAVYNSSLFTIQNVRVSGVEHLTSEEMSALAAVPSGSTLLRVDTAAIEKRLKQDAWVLDVKVNRIFPDTLELAVTEREIAAVVEVPTSDAKANQAWAIASDHMWLMPIPDPESEAGQRTSAKVYEDAEAALVIKDVPFGTKAQVGTYCSDDSVLNALDIVSGMTTELAGRVKTVYAEGVEETRLVLDNNVEIAFGSAENIRDKERVCLEIMEQHPDSVAYINVRDVNSPTYRAL